MKTHTIKTPTAELLIVEVPKGFQATENDEDYNISLIDDDYTLLKTYSKEYYTALGKPDEIREEDARELVESDEISDVDDYRYQITFIDYKDEENAFTTAKESLLSLLESEIYWVNPYDKSGMTFANEYENKWQEAEQKTFDRNRTLIFKKNK